MSIWPTSHPRPTQPSIPPGSVNEYQLRLGRQRQLWFIPLSLSHTCYGRRAACSQAPYDIIQEFLTSRDMWLRRLRSPWNRTMSNKNENRTISLVTKLSYGARSICDWGLSQSMVRQVSRSHAQRLTPGTSTHVLNISRSNVNFSTSLE